MLLSTAAFVVGASVEKNQGHSEPGVAQTHSDEGSVTHQEGGDEGGKEGEEATPHLEGSETIAGINVESTPLIVLGAALSLALAGAALRWPRREVFAVAVVSCLGFAVLDGRELAPAQRSANGVAVLAGLTLALHLAAAAAATLVLACGLRDRRAAIAA
jgi:hypothetical protein